MLLSYGVEVNSTTKLDRSALHAAGWLLTYPTPFCLPKINFNKVRLKKVIHGIKGQWSILCLLINWGANIYSKDVTGNTAMDYARAFGHRQSARGLALYEWHLNKEQRATQKQGTPPGDGGRNIMDQFPSHWLTEIPGCNTPQILCPPMTMNLVAARAANMLSILPGGGAKAAAISASVPTTPELRGDPVYKCGKDHQIPGSHALGVKPRKTLPPITSTPSRLVIPTYDNWLKAKTEAKIERQKQIQAAKEREEQEELLKKERRKSQAAEAFSAWIRQDRASRQSLRQSTSRITGVTIETA
eukprot:sb/3467342/